MVDDSICMTTMTKRKKMVLVLDLNFEVFMKRDADGQALFYVHTHCTCESTFGSAEWLPTINEGVALSRESLEEHEARFACGRKKGG
jgi:hypothetical protein